MRPITRRVFTISLCATALCGLCPAADGVEVPNLEQTLRTGLKPRTPSQDAFLALVVLRVEQGRLPLETVHKVFLWARRQNSYYAFEYFEHGLRRLAEREGIRL